MYSDLSPEHILFYLLNFEFPFIIMKMQDSREIYKFTDLVKLLTLIQIEFF